MDISTLTARTHVLDANDRRDEPASPATPRGHARPHVLIIGCGFAGLAAARTLAGKAADVTIVHRSNHYLFQPLLYQVEG
jgi:NADPH-dependent 2,4-dienoyl-CoA reductase/sulfur reductase-like enzyme